MIYYLSPYRPYGQHWWWVPVLGPFIGGLIGGWLYYLMIELHHPNDPEEDEEQEGQPMNGHTKDGPVAIEETAAP